MTKCPETSRKPQMAQTRSAAIWYFDPGNLSRERTPRYGKVKAFLLEKLYASIGQHDLAGCFNLLKLVPRQVSLDPYILFRYIFILINSVESHQVNKNFVIYLESALTKLNISKPEAFVEYLAYFIRNNRIEDARELLAQRQRSMSNIRHRYVPYVDVHLECYKFLINFHDWSKRIESQKVCFDYTIQGWLVNAMDNLRQVRGNYEFFAAAILQVLLFYGFDKKAYLFHSEMQRNNPDNLSIQLLSNKLLNYIEDKYDLNKKRDMLEPDSSPSEQRREKRRKLDLISINNFIPGEENQYFELCEYPIRTDRTVIRGNVARLDKTLNQGYWEIEQDLIAIVQSTMDSLEYVNEIKSLDRWHSLHDLLCTILTSEDEFLIESLRTLWQTRYQQYWNLEYFLSSIGENSADANIIKNVIRLLSSKLDSKEQLYDVHQDDEPEIVFD